MKQFLYVLLLFFCLSTISCKQQGTSEPILTVTIEPQRYFVEKIAGDRFSVRCIVPAGQSPESYDPTPRQMIELNQSSAYLRIGYIGFEQAWMDNIQANNPNLQVFDLSKGMQLIEEEEEEKAEESHEHHHHHEGGIDPHIWNSIEGAKVIARNTLDALLTLDKDHATYYQQNYESLMGEIQQTEAALQEWLTPLRGKSFIIYHPALTYFAHEYGLQQLCIEMDGKEPSPNVLSKLVETARATDAEIVFIQQEFDQKNAELIANETNCQIVVINPLNYDWADEMRHIAKALHDGKTH